MRWFAFFAALLGGTYFYSNYSIDGLNQLRVRPKSGSDAGLSANGFSLGDRLALLPSVSSDSGRLISTLNSASGLEAPRVRLATFNLHLFGSNKIAKPMVMEAMAKICRQFEVIAIQEIHGNEQDLIPILIQKINQSGRRFDYLIGPRVGRGETKIQLGFLFDTDRIETDRYQLYTVDDPADLLTYEPLVGWFRTKEVASTEAFTFTAVNICLDSNRVEQERLLLAELLESIQKDGRGEDDCMLIGDLQSGTQKLGFLKAAGLAPVIEGVPTDVRGTMMLDNIYFPLNATDEYTGRSGVYDFLREFNLSMDEAMEVSDHLPVWAEFYANEGGQQGRVAKTAIH